MPKLSYISPKATVERSALHGRGLFAVTPIENGEIVAVKGGYIFDRKTRVEMERTLGPAELPVADGLFIDALRPLGQTCSGAGSATVANAAGFSR